MTSVVTEFIKFIVPTNNKCNRINSLIKSFLFKILQNQLGFETKAVIFNLVF